MQQLMASCEELLSAMPFTPSEEDPLQGLSVADRFRVKQAWRQLQRLPWVQQGRLPSTAWGPF